MRKLTATLCLTIAVLLGSAGVSFALPECPRLYNKDTWTNCWGTYTWASGNKYVGEYRNGLRHGQGTFTFADGRVKEGVWKNNEFQY